MQKKRVIAIVGPTAVGKTALSIAVAKRLGGEIINGDSMQVYRKLTIGTAKISYNEMDGVPHHLFDMKDPDESFSVAEFQQLVREKIEEITLRGHLPILVGGTGLYVQSVLFDYQFSSEGKDEKVRKELEEKAASGGIVPLYEKLMRIDEKAAKAIHPNNERRVIRALEVYITTSKTLTEWQQTQIREPLFNHQIIGITMERDLLYERINLRVDLMMEQGLLDEVCDLHSSGLRDVQSIQAIGYKELYDYLDGLVTLEQAVEQIKQNSRRYAKRQITWVRNKMDMKWFDYSHERIQVTEKILTFLAAK